MPLPPVRLFPARAALPHSRRGLTLIEVVVTLVLSLLVIASALRALGTLASAARANAIYSAVATTLNSTQEKYRALTYAPPVEPFAAGSVTSTTVVNVGASPDGARLTVPVTIEETIAPASTGDGHTIAITARYTYLGREIVLTSTSLINEHSRARR